MTVTRTTHSGEADALAMFDLADDLLADQVTACVAADCTEKRPCDQCRSYVTGMYDLISVASGWVRLPPMDRR